MSLTPRPPKFFDQTNEGYDDLAKSAAKPLLTGDNDFDSLLYDCIETLRTKGVEYTGGSVDRLANFRGVSKDVDVPMEKVFYTFFNKHYRALQSYIKNGCKVSSNEPIRSRIMDMMVYLLLFSKMSKEIEENRAGHATGHFIDKKL